MYVPVPCKDCDRRKIACHSSCEEYRKYREWLDSAKKIERLEKSALFNPRINRKSR